MMALKHCDSFVEAAEVAKPEGAEYVFTLRVVVPAEHLRNLDAELTIEHLRLFASAEFTSAEVRLGKR